MTDIKKSIREYNSKLSNYVKNPSNAEYKKDIIKKYKEHKYGDIFDKIVSSREKYDIIKKKMYMHESLECKKYEDLPIKVQHLLNMYTSPLCGDIFEDTRWGVHRKDSKLILGLKNDDFCMTNTITSDNADNKDIDNFIDKFIVILENSVQHCIFEICLNDTIYDDIKLVTISFRRKE